MGPGARHITKSSKDVGVVRCVGDIGQDWVGLGRGLCRSRREGNFIINITRHRHKKYAPRVWFGEKWREPPPATALLGAFYSKAAL